MLIMVADRMGFDLRNMLSVPRPHIATASPGNGTLKSLTQPGVVPTFGRTMIIESPNPGCAAGSLFLDRIAAPVSKGRKLGIKRGARHLEPPGGASAMGWRLSCASQWRALVAHRSCKAMLMPHYFFNTRIGDDLTSDPKGAELRDPDHAWEMARTMILEILRDQRGQPNLLTAILEVTDEHGELVLEFPFSEALISPPDEPPTKH